MYFGGVEESKGGDGEEEGDYDAAAPLPYAVAPVGAPCAAAAGLYAEALCRWRHLYKHASELGRGRVLLPRGCPIDSTPPVSKWICLIVIAIGAH
jgi:hypothetical protein